MSGIEWETELEELIFNLKTIMHKMLHNYYAHKALTLLLETVSFSIASIVIFIETLSNWARIIGALVAVIIGVCAVIRAVWEIKIKRREHDIRRKELEIRDQILWREVEENKKLIDSEDNGNNTRKSLPS